MTKPEPNGDDVVADAARSARLAVHAAGVLGGSPAGVRLGLALAHADGLRADLPDDGLVAMAAGGEQLARWAQVVQSHALVDLVLRWSATTEQSDESAEIGRASVIAEVALATGLSEWAVSHRVVVALGVPDRLPQAHAAFEAGRIDFYRLKAIYDAVLGLSAEQAAAVESDVLDIAVTGTLSALRRALLRAVLRHAPDVAAARAKEAAERRGVSFTKADVDGAALMMLNAPAPRIAQAEASLNLLTDTALAGRDEDDDRSVDAVRADVLLDLIENAADTLHCTAPTESSSTDSGSASTKNGVRRHRQARGTKRRMQVNVTFPLSSILGASDEPGLLEGYGPIPAAMAKEVAAYGAWRCAVTEDREGKVHGTLLGLGRSTFTSGYVPKPTAWQYVTVRDGTCVFPGCNRDATRADLDHRERHRDGGPTCECNIWALCRRHHRLKHQTPLRVADHDDHGTTWQTRTGRQYRTPAPTLPHAPLPVAGDPPPF